MPEPPPTYSEAMIAEHGRSLARLERAALADTLDSVEANTPTLCTGWDAHHLAAHVVLRESTLGEALSPIPKLGDRAVDVLARRRPYDALVAALRAGPPRLSVFALPGVDARLNLVEYFVHHEDVRRAQPDWTARPLPDWAETKLARGLPVLAKLTLRHSELGVRLLRADTGETLDVLSREDCVTLRGLPSELVLFASGRRTAADVEIEGGDEAVRAFTAQSFSL